MITASLISLTLQSTLVAAPPEAVQAPHNEYVALSESLQGVLQLSALLDGARCFFLVDALARPWISRYLTTVRRRWLRF